MNAIGDTYIIKSKNREAHLYIVIGHDEKDNPITVNLTSTRIERSNCILGRGDHPFISRDSGVNYWDTQGPLNSNALREGINRGIVNPQTPVSKTIIEKIIRGAYESKLFPEHLKQYLGR